MRPPPGAEQVRTRSLWPPPPALTLTVVTLVGIFALGWFSVLTQPVQAVAAVWWPASGLALGLGIRTPPRRLWLVCVGVAVVLLGVNFAQYQSVPLAIASSVSAGVEMGLATWIFRTLGSGTPSLDTPRDLAVLLFAVLVGATAYDLTIAATTLATGDAGTAVAQLFSAGPRRAAGTLMVAPLFLRLPTLQRRADPGRTVLQIGAGLIAAVLIFAVNGDLPLAFLALVPPVWGALLMASRWLFVEMLGIATIASVASVTGSGPFSFTRFGPTVGSTLLQAFELTMVTIVLLVSLSVSRERAASARLSAGEIVLRRSFEQTQRLAAEELERAAQVQRALSPSELPSRPGWEHGAAAVPAREVGGDFYDLRIEGRFAAMTLGDVMGKGIGAGILAAAARTALKSVSPASRPSVAIADSVRVIDDDLNRSSAFVTLGYAAIDLVSGEVRLVDAGHGLSFVVRDSGRSIQRLAGSDLPLGIGSDWSELATALAPGDSLLMISDGVLDQWDGSVPTLIDALRALRADPSIGTPQQFVDALCNGGEDRPADGDDSTAVMFHRQEGKQ